MASLMWYPEYDLILFFWTTSIILFVWQIIKLQIWFERNMIYESNRNCPPHRRPGQGSDTQGDKKNDAHQGGRHITDDIDRGYWINVYYRYYKPCTEITCLSKTQNILTFAFWRDIMMIQNAKIAKFAFWYISFAYTQVKVRPICVFWNGGEWYVEKIFKSIISYGSKGV